MSTKKRTILIISLIILFISIALSCAYFLADKTIDNISLEQKDMNIIAKWDKEKTNKYIITLKEKGKDYEETYEAKANYVSIPIKHVPATYIVTVKVKPNIKYLRLFAKKGNASINTEKLKQTITIEKEKYVLLTDESINLNAFASIGTLEYSSDKPDVANVNENGKVTAKKPGEAKIKLFSPEGAYYKEVSKTISVAIYPDKLSAPKLKIKKSDGFSAILSWNKVPYATKYIVYKKHNNEYKKYKRTKKRDLKINRNTASYVVGAEMKVADKKVTSERSNEIEIKPYTDTAKSYKNVHTIEVLNPRLLKEVASIYGTGYSTVPQSFCYDGENYIIAYAPRSGESSAFIVYSKTGKRLTEKPVSMKIANGCTYNPVTEKIYTVHTHMETKTNKARSWTHNTYEMSEFKLPFKASGIAYDKSNDKYYLSGGSKIVVTDSNFKKEKEIKKIRNYFAQDIGAGCGTIINCVWTGYTSYIDIYREKDGAYLGSYEVPFGKLESAVTVHGHIVLLMHNTEFNGSRSGKILITKKKYSTL